MKDFLERHKADIIIFASLVLLGIAILIITLLISPDGEFVKITESGKTVAMLPLDENTTYSTSDGNNTIVIEDGRAYMREAVCPDGLCIKMGKIHSVGERIICLPNKVVVEVVKNYGP